MEIPKFKAVHTMFCEYLNLKKKHIQQGQLPVFLYSILLMLIFYKDPLAATVMQSAKRWSEQSNTSVRLLLLNVLHISRDYYVFSASRFYPGKHCAFLNARARYLPRTPRASLQLFGVANISRKTSVNSQSSEVF